jgi:hypothetical protein
MKDLIYKRLDLQEIDFMKTRLPAEALSSFSILWRAFASLSLMACFCLTFFGGMFCLTFFDGQRKSDGKERPAVTRANAISIFRLKRSTPPF